MDKRIDEIVKEPDVFFVYLTAGYQLDNAHCFGEDSMQNVRSTMKRVKPCQCDECKEIITKAKELFLE